MKKTRRQDPEASTEPSVFAMKRDGVLQPIGKRSFLKAAAFAAVGTTVGCSNDDDDDNPEVGDAVPPFDVGGVTYRLVILRDYNSQLPPSGTNLGVVGFVGDDFFFRRFDESGRLAVNLHESRVEDKTLLANLKGLSMVLREKGTAEAAEQTRFAALFSETTASTGSAGGGRRMQESAGSTKSGGRRMQGSTSQGSVSGQRMQGAEGRPAAGAKPRNVGTITVNGEQYENVTIVETYTDGYSRIEHSTGTVVVRTDALPEIAQMQAPIAVSQSSARPATMPAQPRVTPRPRPAPAPSPTPPRGGGGSHYWRPN